MNENIIRLLINREYLVVDVSLISSFYGSFFLNEIIEKSDFKTCSVEGTELGDFDLQGKMSYYETSLEKLKLTYLDEKAIVFRAPESAELFAKLLAPGIIFKEKMAETDDEDWFGEKLYYGQYRRTPVSLKAGKSNWDSPAFLRSFLQESNDLQNTTVSTGGCFFSDLRNKKMIDLSRTPENHLFVEDEKNLLLGSGLSPFTAQKVLRELYPALDEAFGAIEEPFYHSSSLWDICCFHSKGERLIKAFTVLNTTVSIHNGRKAINVSPALLNKLTPGLPLYFLIPKKS
ncbi:MAG: hypothetical protein Q8908_06110 [Bacteroidota bacterium]|nr:hypothetical protein [Bacteroidota bacterium]